MEKKKLKKQRQEKERERERNNIENKEFFPFFCNY